MGVRVRKSDGTIVEVSAEEAQAAHSSGQAELADDVVRVVSGDNRTGTVRRDKLAAALADGWQIGTEEEAAAKRVRREASSATGTAIGLTEATFSGASLGLTDIALDAIGVEGVGARREALGEAGTAAEVAGGIAASVLTGGGAAAAQGGVRLGAGITAKQVAKRGFGVLAAPTKYATKAGSAVERLVLGQAEAGLGRRVVASAAGSATEGALGGLGGVVSESVIKDKPLTAEALMGGVLGGAAFGGVLTGGSTWAGGALGRVLKGKGAKSGLDVSDDAVRQVVGDHAGIDPSLVSDELVKAARSTDESMLGKVFQKLAPLSGADPDVAMRIGTALSTDAKHVRDVLNRKGQIEQSVAETFQDGLTQINGAMSELRKITGGEAKYASIGRKMPKNADFVAPRLTEQLRESFGARIAAMEAENATSFARAYDVGAVRELKALTGRAFEESLEGAGRAESAAERSFRAVDRLKRDSADVIRQTGGWGAPPPGTTTEMVAANKEARAIYSDAQKHLERTDLWGDAAVAQQEINAAYAAVARAEQDFKSGALGTGLRGLFNPDGTVNMRQAIGLARQQQRMGGNEVVSKLDSAMQAQLDYLDTLAKHHDLGAEGVKQIADAKGAVESIRGRFKSQAADAALLDDLESLRVSESNRSVSMGITSTAGPLVGSILGGAVAGPAGAAAGVIAGGVLRPYSTARSLASLMSMTEDFGRRFDGKGVVEKLRKAYSSAGVKVRDGAQQLKASQRVAAGVKGLKLAAAFQIGQLSASEKAKGIEKLGAHLNELSTPEGIDRVLGPEFEVLSVDAPETAAAIHESMGRLVGFLSSNLPQVHRDPFSGRPPLVVPREADRFVRLASAALNPKGVLNRLFEGTITSEDATALREVYPQHYEAMVDGVRESIMAGAESGKPLSTKARVKLSVLLGVPLDSSMDPTRIAKFQRLYKKEEKAMAGSIYGSNASAKVKTTGSFDAQTRYGTGSAAAATWRDRA